MRHRKTVTIVKAACPEDNTFAKAQIIEIISNSTLKTDNAESRGKDFAKFLFENTSATWLDSVIKQLRKDYTKIYGKDGFDEYTKP